MARLGGIDASFLYMETPETPMHVAGFTVYELPEGFKGSFYEHFRAFFEERLPLIPIFLKKLAHTPYGLHHPGWVDDQDFDLDNHLAGIRLPQPGSWEQAEEAVAALHAELLDRDKPLWKFVVIEGFADGRVALYSKVHHAALDGGAGMVVTRALYDITAVPRAVEKPPRQDEDAPTTPDLAGGIRDLVIGAIRQQNAMLHVLPQLMGAVADIVAPQVPRNAGLKDILPKMQLGELPQLTAPKTLFNVSIGAARSYAARSVSLARAKKTAKSTGTTLNDVVMAACGGALRRYLVKHRALPPKSLLAAVPVSLRAPGNTDLTNQVSMMICSLATNIGDPLERLRAVKKSSSQSKGFVSKLKDVMPQDFTVLGAPVVLSGLASLFGRLKVADYVPPTVNMLISNVPGPPVALYCAGAKVTGLYPVSIPVHGNSANITVQSYLDNLDFGITADRKSVPDADYLADLIVESFNELADAAARAAADEPASGEPAADKQKEARKSSAAKGAG